MPAPQEQSPDTPQHRVRSTCGNAQRGCQRPARLAQQTGDTASTANLRACSAPERLGPTRVGGRPRCTAPSKAADGQGGEPPADGTLPALPTSGQSRATFPPTSGQTAPTEECVARQT